MGDESAGQLDGWPLAAFVGCVGGFGKPSRATVIVRHRHAASAPDKTIDADVAGADVERVPVDFGRVESADRSLSAAKLAVILALVTLDRRLRDYGSRRRRKRKSSNCGEQNRHRLVLR